MKIHIRMGGFSLLVLALVAWGAWQLHPKPASRIATAVMAPEVPVVIRTEGGLLEVATIKVNERFTRSDMKEFHGISLGTTVSHIQAPVHYRYHIQLAKEWRVLIRDKTCIVRAPPIAPSLPVAFDTSAMQMHTENGWARFNKQENLAALTRSITPELEKRAASSSYLQLATEPARQTVREFVTQWLVKEQKWKPDSGFTVKVYFPGEHMSGEQPAGAADQGQQ